jgi:pimeloyl-ACP methyl ester carboxylesterase
MAYLHTTDGRTLEYLVTGPEGATTLFLHGGTPSAALLFDQMVAAALRCGLRIVTHSRAGYAGSSPRPGRDVAAVTEDVTAILDHIGADRFVTLGWSGGGPHALACAALLPGRCVAATSVAGVAPYAVEGLDWLDGMGPENIEEFGAAVAGAEALTAFLDASAPSLANVRGDEIAAALGGLVSDVDIAALAAGTFAEFLAASSRAAVSTGIAGWRDDDLAFVAGWGFDLGAIETPVSIWQGAEDRMVPYAHGRFLATAVPNATVHLEPTEGHLSLIMNAFDDIVAELAERI